MHPNPEDKLRSISSIHGKRIILRRFRETDAPEVLKYGSDADTTRHLIWNGAYTLEEALTAVRDVLMTAPGVFAVTFPDDVCIGAIDLRLEAQHEKAGFGYVLNRQYWGQGIMTEALALLFKISFEILELNRMESHHFSDNPASGKVMLNCGMTREGIALNEYKIKGAFVDVVHYGILRRDWLAQQKDKQQKGK